ncbi:MAG: 30S ribosomal protein S27ae [Candidatus Aenigmarchaeota archaeon]|nr:30S ribosomal protein S27ae [Candidatus Aenigmarchaeota archaeon]
MKHKSTKQWEILKTEGSKIKREKQPCPRCGEGIYMAEHKQKDGKVRYFCGKCHYTLWP